MIVFFLLFVLLLDLYIYFAIENLALEGYKGLVFLVYWLIMALTALGIFSFFRNVRTGLTQMKPSTNILFGLAFSLIVAKLFYAMFLLLEDVFRIAHYLVSSTGLIDVVDFTSRNTFVSITGILVSAIPFLAMAYGVIWGKYRFTTRPIKLKIPHLPAAFNGFKIAQISDAHLGSFDNVNGLIKGLNALQNAKADVIVFTGDMVNNIATEAEPYIDLFKNINAPQGKFSVLGNHDYAEYIRWSSAQAKATNLEHLKHIQHEMGFDMLHNEHRFIKKDGQQICLAGVENWGKPPFPQNGDLKKALAEVPEEMTTVLLSHDPSHWDLQVKQFPKRVDLTLSGHTHGMQFGIDLPFFKWSPVKWKYPKWAGLYQQADRYLYVNRGFGFIGFPGRAGIWPEISVFELVKSE